MKSSFLAVFFLGAAVAACSGTGERPGSGGAGGEEPTTSSDSSASSSGMGGAGGNGTGGAGGMGGSAPMVSADKLGQVCNQITPCPMGYSCVILPMTAGGFCTLPCGGAMDMTTCSPTNGFMGPGQGRCALGAQDMAGNITPVCGIFCGTQFMLPEMCPTGLTCQDKFSATGMPGTDGKTDLCVP